jgi:hypothetical protein
MRGHTPQVEMRILLYIRYIENNVVPARLDTDALPELKPPSGWVGFGLKPRGQ